MMLSFSVVIPSFKDPRILETIDSILSQDLDPELSQIIVIDGGSGPDLLEPLQAKLRSRDVLVAEPDEGIFDGINKGVRLATRDLILTIGSDDVLATPSALSTFAAEISAAEADFAVCGTIYTRQDLSPLRHWPATLPTVRNLLLGRQTCHFAFACRPSVYEQVGLFDLQFATAADYDFFARLAKQESLRGVAIPEYLVKMRQGGNSSRNVRNILKGNADIRRILVKHFGPLGPLVLLLKPIWKLAELLRTRLRSAEPTAGSSAT